MTDSLGEDREVKFTARDSETLNILRTNLAARIEDSNFVAKMLVGIVIAGEVAFLGLVGYPWAKNEITEHFIKPGRNPQVLQLEDQLMKSMTLENMLSCINGPQMNKNPKGVLSCEGELEKSIDVSVQSHTPDNKNHARVRIFIVPPGKTYGDATPLQIQASVSDDNMGARFFAVIDKNSKIYYDINSEKLQTVPAKYIQLVSNAEKLRQALYSKPKHPAFQYNNYSNRRYKAMQQKMLTQ